MTLVQDIVLKSLAALPLDTLNMIGPLCLKWKQQRQPCDSEMIISLGRSLGMRYSGRRGGRQTGGPTRIAWFVSMLRGTFFSKPIDQEGMEEVHAWSRAERLPNCRNNLSSPKCYPAMKRESSSSGLCPQSMVSEIQSGK